MLGTLEGDAYADGGDRFWLDDTTALIGLGYRTNQRGAARLAELLEPEGVHVETYDMPHDQGAAYVLHLQSFLSAATESLFVVYEPLARSGCCRISRRAASSTSRSTMTAIWPWAATSSRCGRAWS